MAVFFVFPPVGRIRLKNRYSLKIRYSLEYPYPFTMASSRWRFLQNGQA